MDTIVFIETNKSGSSREAIKAAEKLNFFTVLLTKKTKFINERTIFPDVHQMIFTDINDYDNIITTIEKLNKSGKNIKGIFSFIDPYVYMAARLSEKFCSNIVSTKAIHHMENKILTRNVLKDLPISLNYSIYKPTESLSSFFKKNNKINFPLIVKSPKSTGSKDVLLVKNKDQLILSIQSLLNKLPNEEILLEEYIDGPQYLVEILVQDGKVHIIAVIEQEITFFERFIVTGYSLLGRVEKRLYNSLFNAINSVIQAFNMKNGACHLELRRIDNVWKLIEINPRISGGAMNDIIEIGHGINLVQETIRLMLGNKPSLVKKHYKYVYAHYLTVKSTGKLIRVTGKNRSSKYPGVEKVFIKPKKGTTLKPPTSMGHRCGYVLAAADFKAEAKKIALEAAKEISFEIQEE
ncbi:biotin carboxylase [Bacillus toyonensis]|uniref:Biotin carboxylase n=4 Tax=Bacillus toyonensis TaxID=155322 RepID=A0A2C5P3D7_9BACI|nr:MULTISPECIES: ATP-grasp domain-containing protein [Bacillus cereus group]OTX00178.1 biotin carboxylase [Bacillus thuringiensis serovar seoulensis]QPW48411.1 ATP-grasp domain-containing protein [Bacillus thuringiensis]MCA1046806.1 ATP-grasp domain-containing protein [Bacillus toyonensis]MCG3794789.1 ATP-grasp domain-containing protein [Bacillus toyonensis]MDO8159912.1 ATP-grasp domain-containing protein [Bacillus toyonensis]